MTFENSLKRLDEIVAGLENNDITLEESMEMYREGVTLLGDCRKQLSQAEMLVTVDDSEN